MGRHRTALAPVSGPIVSAGISVVIAVIYLGIVVRQDQRVSARSVFVASLLVAIAIALVASFRVASSEGRAALLAVAANSLIAIGFLALFSVGLPLMLAGGLAIPSTA